jgi:hypothetical protein
MARVFRGTLAMPGDQMEASFDALGPVENAKAPMRTPLEQCARDLERALAQPYAPTTVRKPMAIIALFIDFVGWDTDVCRMEAITHGMANSAFRQWSLRKGGDRTASELKTASQTVCPCLAQDKGITNEAVLKRVQRELSLACSRYPSLVMVLQAPHLGPRHHSACARSMDRARLRTIHRQRPMRPPPVILGNVARQEPLSMALVQNEHVVQAVAADAPDQPLDVGGLPRTPRSHQDFFKAPVWPPLPKRGAIDAVPIAPQIPWGLVPRKRAHHLRRGPLRRRGGRDLTRDDAASFMGQDEQHAAHMVCHRRDDKDIQGPQVLPVVLQKSLPRGR